MSILSTIAREVAALAGPEPKPEPQPLAERLSALLGRPGGGSSLEMTPLGATPEAFAMLVERAGGVPAGVRKTLLGLAKAERRIRAELEAVATPSPALLRDRHVGELTKRILEGGAVDAGDAWTDPDFEGEQKSQIAAAKRALGTLVQAAADAAKPLLRAAAEAGPGLLAEEIEAQRARAARYAVGSGIGAVERCIAGAAMQAETLASGRVGNSVGELCRLLGVVA
jgi:hypothetical protein